MNSPADKTKPFDYAQDVTKQLIALATGVVTITVSFLKDVVKDAPHCAQVVLYVSWALFAFSVFAGVCTLLNLTGHVGKASDPASDGVMAKGIRIFSIAQIVSFVAALAGVVYFGSRAFG